MIIIKKTEDNKFIMGNVKRIYVEKKEPFAVKARELKEEIQSYLNISGVEDVRVFIRYDVENLSDAVFEKACKGIFAEPPVDDLYYEKLKCPKTVAVFRWSFCQVSLISVRTLRCSACSF